MTDNRERKNLLDFQFAVLAEIKKEIRDRLEPITPALSKYYQEYKGEFIDFTYDTVGGSLASREELSEDVLESNLVYCGDYHTLRQSQKTNVKILKHIVPHRRVILCVEMFQIQHQPLLDAFMAAELSEEEFLKEIDYWETWGFNWDNHGQLLRFAQRYGLKVVALNSEPYSEKRGLRSRDRRAAKIIARLTEADEAALIHVVFGDLHVATCHLPAEVDRLLARKNLRRRKTVVFQNSETLYIELMKYDMEHEADVVRVRPRIYCVMNTPPWIKLQSYLQWTDRSPELSSKLQGTFIEDADPEDIIPYNEEVYAVIRLLADYVGIEEVNIDAFDVFTLDDLSFMKRFRCDPRLPRMKKMVMARASFSLPREGIIYLGSLNFNSVAEEGGSYLFHLSSSLDFPFDGGPEAFYLRALFKAVGYFCSKVANHKRKTKRILDFVQMSEELRHRRLTGKAWENRLLARTIIEHQRLMEELEQGARSSISARKIYELDVEIAFRVSHALGHLTGEYLYTALIQEIIGLDYIQALFHQGQEGPFDPFLVVRELYRFKNKIFEEYPSKDDFF